MSLLRAIAEIVGLFHKRPISQNSLNEVQMQIHFWKTELYLNIYSMVTSWISYSVFKLSWKNLFDFACGKSLLFVLSTWDIKNNGHFHVQKAVWEFFTFNFFRRNATRLQILEHFWKFKLSLKMFVFSLCFFVLSTWDIKNNGHFYVQNAAWEFFTFNFFQCKAKRLQILVHFDNFKFS